MKNDQRIKAVDDKTIMDKIIGFRSYAVAVEFFEKEFLHRLVPVGFMVSGFPESYGRSHPDVEAVHTDQKRT